MKMTVFVITNTIPLIGTEGNQNPRKMTGHGRTCCRDDGDAGGWAGQGGEGAVSPGAAGASIIDFGRNDFFDNATSPAPTKGHDTIDRNSPDGLPEEIRRSTRAMAGGHPPRQNPHSRHPTAQNAAISTKLGQMPHPPAGPGKSVGRITGYSVFRMISTPAPRTAPSGQ